jgi:hypothetical protein
VAFDAFITCEVIGWIDLVLHGGTRWFERVTAQAEIIRQSLQGRVGICGVRPARSVARLARNRLVMIFGLERERLSVALEALLLAGEHRVARGNLTQSCASVVPVLPERWWREQVPAGQVAGDDSTRHKDQTQDLGRHGGAWHGWISGVCAAGIMG